MRIRDAISIATLIAIMGLPGVLLIPAETGVQLTMAWLVWITWMIVVTSRDPMVRLGLLFAHILGGVFFTVLPEANLWGSLLAFSQILLVYGAYREQVSRSVERRPGGDGARGDQQDQDPSKPVDSILDVALGAIRALAEMGAGSLSTEQADSLTQPVEALTEQEAISLLPDNLSESLLRGFFHAASHGQTFADPSRIAHRYGKTLEGGHPGASPAFLSFASTFWTLKLLLEDLWEQDTHTLAPIVLTKLLDVDLAPIFFPSPGHDTMPVAEREARQRELLGQFTSIDVEDFIGCNPVFTRDGRRSGSLQGLVKSLRIWIPLLPLLVVLGLWASLIGGWAGISAAVVGVVTAPILFRRNYLYVFWATAALWVLLIPMSVVAGRDRIALAGLLGVIGLATWHVFGMVTFRRGLVRANVVSYFYRRQAGESHDDAVARVIRTRYPEARWKQEAINDLYADSHVVNPSEAEDLAAVVMYMYAFETGRVLDEERLREFQDEIRGSISEHEARFTIPLKDHTRHLDQVDLHGRKGHPRK